MSGFLLRFELSGKDVTPDPAPLSIHLHNTQRKVQIQGGATMPDQSRVPIWFVEKVLKEMFTDQAKAKKYQIGHINELVTAAAASKIKNPLPAQTPATCFHCQRKFSSNSRPTICTRCSNYKHSRRCVPCPERLDKSMSSIHSLSSQGAVSFQQQASTHSSPPEARALPGVSTLTEISTTSPPPQSDLSNPTSVTPTTLAAKSPSLPPNIVVPAPAVVTPHSVTPLAASTATAASQGAPDSPLYSTQSRTVTPSVVALSPTPSTTAPPSMSSRGQTPRNEQTSSNPHIAKAPTVTKKNARTKKQPALALTPEAAEIAFLKQELNQAKTRITVLDSEVEDLNKTIKIQNYRLKIFEDS